MAERGTDVNPASIIIVSGPPGAGKTTIADALARSSPLDRAVHLHTDDFYGAIRKGFVEPWSPEARHQNEVVIEAFTACTERYARGGYHVFVDGVIGPWHLEPWLQLAGKGLSVDYVILRPDEKTTVDRAAARGAQGALVDRGVVAGMWGQFAGLNDYESNVVDTTRQSVERAIAAVRAAVADGRTRIPKR